MYDEIFKAFETIKSHCHKNGNKKFEESAIFELLENLYPIHGSMQTIAIVTEMLDAQSIRDCRDSSNDSNKVEILESDKSNDTDSIIELEVPPKIHPIVDLTNNSPLSDDANTVEKLISKDLKNSTKNDFDIENSSSGISDNDYHGLNDADITKQFEGDEWGQAFQNIIENSNSGPLQNFLFNLYHKPTSNQLTVNVNNSGIVEDRDISEMLEENNNDPNNNLDGGILDEEPVNISNVLEPTEPVPSCSKHTDIWQNNDNSLPQADVCKSPVPGCSKDVDNSNELESSSIFEDESIKSDANCIQEIIPWANKDTIYSLLKKYHNSTSRKQLTLWDLMSEASSTQANAKVVKRKQSDDLCKIPKKSPKTEYIDESWLDFPSNVQSNNTACNESSNDSRSSKMSECNEFNSEITDKNQKEQITVTTDSPKTLFSNNNQSTISQQEKSANNVNNYKIMDEEANLMPDESIKNPFLNSTNNQIPKPSYYYSLPLANRPVKKQRSETIVSGSLIDYSNNQTIDIRISSNDSEDLNIKIDDNKIPKKNFFGESINEFTHLNNKDIEAVKLEDSFFKNEPSDKEGTTSNANKKFTELIQPSKLTLNHTVIHQQKIAVRQDLGYQSKRQAVNIKQETITQPNQLITKAAPHIQQQTKDRIVVKSGQFSAAIENPFSEKPKNEHGLSIKPATSTGIRPSIFPDFYKPTPLTGMLKKHSQPIVTPNKAVTTATKIAKVQQFIHGSPKVQPTATITSSMIPQIPSAKNVPSTSGVQKIATPRSTEVPNKHIYTKLRSIFPDVKKSYVKKICITPPNGVNYNSHSQEQILNVLIDHLLQEGHNHLQRRNLIVEAEQQNQISSLSVDEKYEYLLGIFPDADPTYLRNFVEKSCTTEQILQEFIQKKMEKKDYPTKEQYLAKIKITEQIKQYTTDFKVEKFLELFPDPFKHFEDANRKVDYQPIAMEFLKAFFNRIKINTISRQYLRSGYNLSLAAKVLSETGHDMKSKRMTQELITEDIPLLQELAFVKNKENIQQYLDALKTKEEKLFKELQEKNLLLTCQCCFNDECMPTKSSECSSGHVFCFDCIIRGTESKLADGEAHVRCFTNCDSEFPLATLQKVLPPTKFSALLKKRQAAEIMAAGMDDLVSCPFCHFASIPPPEDKVFKCLNPECMKETCRQCKELNHIPLRCDEVIKADKVRRLIEEKMTEALLRTCYNCKKSFYKEEGCNKMTCNCGALMCYLCDKPVKGYDHFNPQGGSNTHLCPLWSDDRRLNAEAVRKVAENMKKAMQQVNPNLNIDMDALLPKLPPRSKGAHDDIPNANELPEHVRRVAAP